jgi:hypothetical protein
VGAFPTEVLPILATGTPSTVRREESPIPTSNKDNDSDSNKETTFNHFCIISVKKVTVSKSTDQRSKHLNQKYIAIQKTVLSSYTIKITHHTSMQTPQISASNAVLYKTSDTFR